MVGSDGAGKGLVPPLVACGVGVILQVELCPKSFERLRAPFAALLSEWNLIELAEALYPLIGSIPPLEEALVAYTETYEAEESRLFAAKLGLTTPDKPLVDQLFQLLAMAETDMTPDWARHRAGCSMLSCSS